MLQSPLNPIQREVMRELQRTLQLLGARADLLAILAEWDATHGDAETLSESPAVWATHSSNSE